MIDEAAANEEQDCESDHAEEKGGAEGDRIVVQLGGDEQQAGGDPEHEGVDGLIARPVSGRPPKLTLTQEKIVRRWLGDSPSEHGFDTELWTARRLSQLIHDEFGTRLNPRYLSAWMRDRGLYPQKPGRVPRERDPEAIAAWLESDWPRIKKRPGGRAPTSP